MPARAISRRSSLRRGNRGPLPRKSIQPLLRTRHQPGSDVHSIYRWQHCQRPGYQAVEWSKWRTCRLALPPFELYSLWLQTRKNRKLLFSTVSNESGLTIEAYSYALAPVLGPLTASNYPATVSQLLAPPRNTTILRSGRYNLPPNEQNSLPTLERLGTDYICMPYFPPV